MTSKKITIDKVRRIVKNAIRNENGVTLVSVKPNRSGEYCTVILEGDVYLKTLNAIEEAVGDEPIIGGEECGKINLFFRIPDTDKVGCTEPEEDAAPAIPDYMRHKEQFYDSEDVVIPGTEMNCSNTEQCEKIKAWMKETGHTPIVYVRLKDGLHVEVSNLYDRKIKDVLERGEAVGGDGRKYRIEDPDDIFAIGSNICVRATCIETGRNDAYGLDFFA